MKTKLALLLIFAVCALFGTASAAVEPGEDFYYLDTANVLSEETEGTIFFCNQLLYEKCGGQIVVAALDSIGDEDIYDYAYDLFNEWGIGSAEENSGFLLLMAIEEDNYYALSGAGIDRIFSSGVIGELNDDVLEPYFAKKNYDAGALNYFEAVLERYADYYNLDLDLEDGRSAYDAYVHSNSDASSLGGAHGGGAYPNDGPTSYWNDNESYFGFGLIESIGSIVAEAVGNMVLLIIFCAVIYLFIRHPWLAVLFKSGKTRHDHPVHHHRSSRSSGSSRSTSFGGSFGGGRSSGFGVGRSGGGRSFGGGAGRGRR